LSWLGVVWDLGTPPKRVLGCKLVKDHLDTAMHSEFAVGTGEG
jgi:hypothetical protein